MNPKEARPLNMFCLWLLPEPSNRPPFSSQIEHLSSNNKPSPVFDPHITFLSGFGIGETDLEQFKAKTVEGLKKWYDESLKHGEGGSAGSESDERPILELPMEKPIAGETYYTAIIYPIKQSTTPSSSLYNKLFTGRKIVEDIFDKPTPSNRPFFPHLSLLYSDESQSRCEEIKNAFVAERQGKKVEEGGLQGNVRVGSCVVVRCQGTADKWVVEAEYGLDGREIA